MIGVKIRDRREELKRAETSMQNICFEKNEDGKK